MRRIVKFLILSFFFTIHLKTSYCQDEVVYYDISGNIQLVGLGYYAKICQGEEFMITLNGISISLTDVHYKWANYADCIPFYNLSIDYQEENNSLSWNGSNLRLDANNRNIAYARPPSNGEYSISWHTVEYFPANRCRGAYKKTSYYFGTSRRVVVIPKPSPPTLTADKATLRFPESTVIRTSGCPNTLLDEGYPSAQSLTQIAYGCDNNGNPVFNQNMAINDILSFSSGHNYYGMGVNSFYAKCNDNGCWSDSYTNLKVSVQSNLTNPNEIINTLDAIDNTSGRRDYHYYFTQKEICVKSDSDPNCNKNRVYNLLLTSKTNQGPIASDFVGAGSTNNLSQLFGSNLLYSIDDTPINNNEELNLPGPWSILVGGVSLLLPENNESNGKKIRNSFLDCFSNVISSANPIRILVDNNSFSVTNYTLPGHFLYPGKVVRTVVEECDKIKIITIGVGYSWAKECIDNLLGEKIGQKIGETNVFFGGILFNSIDERFKNEYDNLAK